MLVYQLYIKGYLRGLNAIDDCYSYKIFLNQAAAAAYSSEFMDECCKLGAIDKDLSEVHVIVLSLEDYGHLND
jgi:hypothetical protein